MCKIKNDNVAQSVLDQSMCIHNKQKFPTEECVVAFVIQMKCWICNVLSHIVLSLITCISFYHAYHFTMHVN